MKKLKNFAKKLFVAGAVILGTIAPVHADSTVEVSTSTNDAVIEMVQPTVGQYRVEMTNADWKAFVASQGWSNYEVVGNNGEFMIIKAYDVCGNYVADVFLKVIEDVVVEEPEVNFDDQIAVLPEFDYVVENEVVLDGTANDNMMVEPEVNFDDQIAVLPEFDYVVEDEVVLDGTANDNMMVEPEVNFDDQIAVLPDDFLVEEEQEEVLDGTDNDNMMVTPEVFEPVLDGTDMDDIGVTPTVKFDGELDITNDSEPVLDGTDIDDMGVTPVVPENNDVPSNKDNTVSNNKKPVKVNKTENSTYSPILSDSALNPKTGDTSVFLYFAIAMLTMAALVFNNRKSCKCK